MAETNHPASKKRRWKRLLLGAVGVLLLLALTHPLWFPWVLKPVAAGLGVQFESFQRHGYARIELLNAHWQSGSISVRAEHLELQMPHRWLWTRLSGAPGIDPQVRVQAWTAEIAPSEQSSDGGTASTTGLLDDLQAVVPSLAQWVHWVEVTRGEVKLPGHSLAIASATLRDETLTVDAFESRASVDLGSLSSSVLGLSVSNELATAEIELKQEGADWTFLGGVTWQSNRFELNGWFDHSSWLPAVATLGSDAFELPSVLSGWREFPDLHGRVQAAWTNGGYTFDVNLTDQLATGSPSQADSISLHAGGSGDLAVLELNRLNFTAPFLTATLDKPLTFDFGGSVEGWNTSLNLWVDLSQMPAIAAEGQVSGVLTVKPSLTSPLRVGFGLSGTNLASAGLRSTSVALEGLLHWPMLEVTNLTAEFDAGSKLSAGFELEIHQGQTGVATSEAGRDGALRGPAPRAAVQRLEDSAQNRGWHLRQLHWDYDGPLPVLLPESVTLKTIHGSGSAEGVWPELSHAGSVELSGIEAGPFRAATGRMSWSGRQLLMDRISVQVANGASTVAVEGKGGMTPRTGGMDAHLALNTFDLVTRDGVWRLQEPVRLEMARASNTFALDLPPLELTGPDRRLAMQASVLWPSNGSGRISLQGLRSGDLDEFIAPDLPALSVPEATVAFGWNNGPLTFDVQAQAEWREGDDSVWSVDCAARSDGDSMQFDPVRVDLNGAPAVMLTGHLPLHIEPGAGWRIGESAGSQAVQLDLQVMERGPLWAFLEEYAGVRIGSPSLTFQARGEAPNIDGHLSFSAANVALTQTNTGPALVIPQLDNPRFEARVGLKGLEIRGASAELLGQPIQAEADWEVMASDWNEWLEAILACDLARLTGWVRVDDAEISALAALVPDFIAPAGTLDLDLAMRPGLRVEGHLVLTNATTRYLRPVGALRNIEADITLNGWNGTINRFSGTLGGQPVDLSGELAWRPDGDRQFDLSLTGENLPLVRDPEFFVRADLDVRLQKSFGEVARLSGGVTLQHSLLFRDFSMLVGPDLQRPDQRPPYFSIPQPPLGDWQLDLSVKGDRFLHVVSPAFKGEVSAGLRLLGTLREPFTVGTVTVDQGKILFPFGMVELENGRVELSREDPYRPRVDFRATGQNFGYTITVDLTGPVDAPNLTFQSVPPLTAQQILLMLSAGEIPRSDFSYSSTDKASKVGFYIGNEFVNRFIGNTSTSERLFFRSGEQITDDGKPTYSLEYRFTDRWSVFGEYNRFRDFNSGLKLKVLSK